MVKDYVAKFKPTLVSFRSMGYNPTDIELKVLLRLSSRSMGYNPTDIELKVLLRLSFQSISRCFDQYIVNYAN